ncbi:MAG: M15 family metallopeptidase [Bryobacterales bacterium]|nr:M15 family metallopeptidase [Bryobacterales bacterium]
MRVLGSMGRRGCLYFAALLLSACGPGAPEDLIDVRDVIPDVRLEIRYATPNNFTKSVLYPEARCVLRREVAEELAKVQRDLKAGGLELVIYDCYRPLSVQKKMWEIVPNEAYVANPAKGSRHNRGAAVDVGLFDSYGKRVEMPTDFDDFSEKAHYSNIDLPAGILINRQKLRTMMERYNFAALPTEWWHFDFLGWQRFPVMDVPFQDVPE